MLVESLVPGGQRSRGAQGPDFGMHWARGARVQEQVFESSGSDMLVVSFLFLVEFKV